MDFYNSPWTQEIQEIQTRLSALEEQLPYWINRAENSERISKEKGCQADPYSKDDTLSVDDAVYLAEQQEQ